MRWRRHEQHKHLGRADDERSNGHRGVSLDDREHHQHLQDHDEHNCLLAVLNLLRGLLAGIELRGDGLQFERNRRRDRRHNRRSERRRLRLGRRGRGRRRHDHAF
jgi:hypothetical protein